MKENSKLIVSNCIFQSSITNKIMIALIDFYDYNQSIIINNTEIKNILFYNHIIYTNFADGFKIAIENL